MATGVPRSFQVTGRGGVPAGAKAVTGNLVAVAPNSGGYLALAPGVSATPATSSLNVPRGDVRAASVTLPLDAAGRLGVVWKGTPGSKTHVIFDVTGYFVGDGSGATFFGIDASRVLDSRVANGLAGAFGTNVVRALQATGRGAVPLDAVARDRQPDGRRPDRRRLGHRRAGRAARSGRRRRSTSRGATSGRTA